MTKKLSLIIVLIGILLLGAFYMLGYTIANSTNNNDSTPESVSDNHTHQLYEIPPGEPIPKITLLDVQKDSKSGWNIRIDTENFDFTPEQANGEHQPGKGHAHLYIDGVKITRIYSNFYYLGGYDDGVHEVLVTLNTNSHSDYAVDGQSVSATAKIIGSHEHEANTPEEHEH